jgi:hypothetical protein
VQSICCDDQEDSDKAELLHNMIRRFRFAALLAARFETLRIFGVQIIIVSAADGTFPSAENFVEPD